MHYDSPAFLRNWPLGPASLSVNECLAFQEQSKSVQNVCLTICSVGEIKELCLLFLYLKTMQNIYLKHNYQLVCPGCKVKSQSPMRFELPEIRTITALIKTKKDWTRALF